MFYSHTFLARKGPLGTVWCAAHLQHKLKKSHYISTNVSDTAERIMCPEVPIALRLSGHLLLGVVRIYSKQVDYLYEDCSQIRISINRVFTTVSINLPNEATHAPVHSITLPDKFDLDAIELDDYSKDWGEDPNLKSQVDITLTEQIPSGNDPYIIISFDEQQHDLRASPIREDEPGSGPSSMEENAPPDGTQTAPPESVHPSPKNQFGANDTFVGNSSQIDPPSIEKMREAPRDFGFDNSPKLPVRAEPDTFLVDLINNERNIGSPVIKEIASPSGRHSLSDTYDGQYSSGHLNSSIPFASQSPQMGTRLSPAGVRQSPEFGIQLSPFGVHPSPEMELLPTPPVAQPRVGRKRKQHYDEITILTNKHMKKALDDTSNIRRKRKNCPTSSLAFWKQNNMVRLIKEGLFVVPFITGCSTDLQDMYKEDSAKRHRVFAEDAHQEANAAQPPVAVGPEETHNETNATQPPDAAIAEETHQTDAAQPPDIEIETLRNNDFASPSRFMPGPSTSVRSPNERSPSSPVNSSLGLQSEHWDTSGGNDISPTTYRGESRNLDSEIRTPDTFAKNIQPDDTPFSDIPELVASPGELRFLEQDDASPAGSQGTPPSGMLSQNQRTLEMSARTRAVAQYLEKQAGTPISGNPDEQPDELSLNKILEGKTRKICARMFYETLVLKSLGLVETRQEDPYGDITLKVTPKLSKGKFTS